MCRLRLGWWWKVIEAPAPGFTGGFSSNIASHIWLNSCQNTPLLSFCNFWWKGDFHQQRGFLLIATNPGGSWELQPSGCWVREEGGERGRGEEEGRWGCERAPASLREAQSKMYDLSDRPSHHKVQEAVISFYTWNDRLLRWKPRQHRNLWQRQWREAVARKLGRMGVSASREVLPSPPWTRLDPRWTLFPSHSNPMPMIIFKFSHSVYCGAVHNKEYRLGRRPGGHALRESKRQTIFGVTLILFLELHSCGQPEYYETRSVFRRFNYSRFLRNLLTDSSMKNLHRCLLLSKLFLLYIFSNYASILTFLRSSYFQLYWSVVYILGKWNDRL